MSAPVAKLQGFAYGEHLEGAERRSLGYRLLAPGGSEPWCNEVETLARRLQAAPYPDHWPPTELFCSVLLADGRRVVAVARYGLADQTPGRRRGGLELVGVVGPGSLGVPSALAVYRWLRQRSADATDPRSLGGEHVLPEVLAAVPPVAPPDDPAPVLPIRLWREGALLFAATAPAEPDHRLALLEQEAGGSWQWLPLVGEDFPLQAYAQRGPLIAWTPHLAGVALKLDRPPAEIPPQRTGPRLLVGVLLLAILLLAGSNLWAVLSLSRAARPAARTTPPPTSAQPPAAAVAPAAPDASVDRFARALYRLIQRQGGTPELSQKQITEQYERLAAQDGDLRLPISEGKEVVTAVNVLSHRSAERVRAAMHSALEGKGYDPKLIDLACQKVYDQLAAEGTEAP